MNITKIEGIGVEQEGQNGEALFCFKIGGRTPVTALGERFSGNQVKQQEKAGKNTSCKRKRKYRSICTTGHGKEKDGNQKIEKITVDHCVCTLRES